MKIIKLTKRLKKTYHIYINIDHIGHFHQLNEYDHRNNVLETYTKIGITTSDEGYDVKETPEEIIEMCNSTKSKTYQKKKEYLQYIKK